MAEIRLTHFTARVTFLGRVISGVGLLHAEPETALELTYAGVVGELHEGRTRKSCVRVKDMYAEGTEIANVRQLSILSAEELALMAEALGLAVLDPGLLGATMVVEGIPDFSHVPPSSRLQAPSGATLVVNMENRPCVFPGRSVEARHPGKGKLFKPAAKGRRGVTAWVEREGRIELGDALKLFIPDQPSWAGL
jgi:MOSC domain-containing protein YiiM